MHGFVLRASCTKSLLGQGHVAESFAGVGLEFPLSGFWLRSKASVDLFLCLSQFAANCRLDVCNLLGLGLWSTVCQASELDTLLLGQAAVQDLLSC